MKINGWLEKFKEILDKEEVRHLDIHKVIIKMQFTHKGNYVYKSGSPGQGLKPLLFYFFLV